MLTTIEAALSGGVLLLARDGALRDMASMHGSYRKVEETAPALRLIGQTLADFQAAEALWLLDRPVSNSGRLKKIIEDLAAECGWKWTVELVHNPDLELSQSDAVIATADSGILDLCGQWVGLARRRWNVTRQRHGSSNCPPRGNPTEPPSPSKWIPLRAAVTKALQWMLNSRLRQ